MVLLLSANQNRVICSCIVLIKLSPKIVWAFYTSHEPKIWEKRFWCLLKVPNIVQNQSIPRLPEFIIVYKSDLIPKPIIHFPMAKEL